VTVKDLGWYASVVPSACGLEKQKAASVAAPGLAEAATTSLPLQAPEARTDRATDPSPRPFRERLTRTIGGPCTPGGSGGHGVIDDTVIELPGGPAAGVRANMAEPADTEPTEKASQMHASVATNTKRRMCTTLTSTFYRQISRARDGPNGVTCVRTLALAAFALVEKPPSRGCYAVTVADRTIGVDFGVPEPYELIRGDGSRMTGDGDDWWSRNVGPYARGGA
jgi:hypothetical protein